MDLRTSGTMTAWTRRENSQVPSPSRQTSRASLDRTAEGGCPHMCSALGGGDQAGFAIFDLEVVGIAHQTAAGPRPQIQQAPVGVLGVAGLGAMFRKQAFVCGARKRAAIHTPPPQ